MDTCEGDSGGPLQVKLMHHVNLTPFVVAVTSFGLPCGLSNPGVYTKIAPYHDWIVSTMQQSNAAIPDDIFNATFCALRFQKHREYIYSTPLNKTHVYELRGMTDHIYKEKPLSYLVKLLWNVTGGSQNCYGTIIDENTVLTVADCVYHEGIPASSVSHPEGIVNIAKIIVHPQYDPRFGYKNMAILRLEALFSFIKIRPACTDYGKVSIFVPNNVFGMGRKDIYDCISFPDCIDPSLIPLTVYVQPKTKTSCMISREVQSRFPNGITSELFCAGVDRFLVPEACDLKLGGSYSNINKILTNFLTTIDDISIAIDGDMYPALDGLVQNGRDCGYGEHLITTNLRSHLKWMERVLLPKRATANAVQFLDPSRREGDPCFDTYKIAGRCTSISRCQRKWKNFELTQEANFCSSTSVICCPLDDIDKDAWSTKYDLLMECPKLVHALLPENNGAPMVRIFDSETRYICMGAIISDRTILTSASCVGTAASLSVQPLEKC
ncbi:uncharacterized protein LOC110680917 [Aedes aegypti]|uniref:Peptidase S1 domain-containing protein n=1 Tax=Aedes aegypti TaxID=7159 RepID=A0A903VUE9_AEDAE|nr:uncharacterized protein LOC110680917 [Aedes aegypti]